MRRRRALVRAGLAFAICACARESARADNTPPPTRLSAAVSGGPTVGFDVSTAGSAPAEPAAGVPNILAALGFDRNVVGWLALGVEARVGSWDSAWSQAAGYDSHHGRVLFDFDAVIRFRSPVVMLTSRPVVFSLSPSAGFTWPQAPSRDTRAVKESWQARGDGGNAGVELTAETWFGFRRSRWKLGAAAGIGYTRHWFALDGEFTPVSDPGAAVSGRYHYVVDQILLRATFLAGF